MLILAACGASDESSTSADPDSSATTAGDDADTETSNDVADDGADSTDTDTDTDTNTDTDSAEPAGTDADPDSTGDGESSDSDSDSAEPAGGDDASCDTIAAAFVTKGSANDNLPDPEVAASCDGANVTVTSNQIPDFPYIETSPGVPRVYDLEFTFPATPTAADEASDIPALGAIAVAINGIPIYGATEGTGGDVMSLTGGFTECGGHNGPTGYHYHTFDTTGSDVCLFSEAEASAAPQLFGYAFDGYPIYSGNYQFESSWQLTDESLFATDTFSAHSYVEGSGDLDQCNGRTDENGNYAYYTTDTFPYTLGCYHGVVDAAIGGGGAGGGPAGGGGPPPGGDDAGEDNAGGPPTDGNNAGPPPGRENDGGQGDGG